MTTLHMVAQTYGQRPSRIVGIRSSRLAYQFDVAVLASVSVQPSEAAQPQQRYSVPGSLPVRRMAIPDSGVW